MGNLFFEHTRHLSEAEYVDIRAAFFGLRRSHRLIRRALAIAVGVACLFWVYTVPLGVALLGLTVLHMVMPRVLRWTAARQYRETTYLHSPVTYGLDDTQLWVRSSDFEVRAGWRHAAVWLESDPWLLLSVHSAPLVVLPLADIRAQGKYDDLMALVQRHAAKVGSAAARQRRSKPGPSAFADPSGPP